MDSLRNAWNALDARRRVFVALATVGVFAAVLGLARLSAPGADMALLYAGLDGAAAGEVIGALDQRGVVYEVRGDAIYVPSAERDALRLTLAGEGMPAGGAQGYELLDSLSGFGTTAQMFDAAYWRAKEGELARTILAVPGVSAARVHISAGAGRAFQRQDRPTAAVTVSMAAGGLTAEQGRALRFLVASAVAGLDPADVAIIDGAGNLLAIDDADLTGQTRAEDLRSRAERLLEARVGYGNAVVEVTVEAVTESESITERLLDPDTRVAISTAVEEQTSTATDQGAGAVTVASNLPDGDAGGGGGSQSQDSETRTTTNFDLSETSREIIRAPGAIRRMTVAVLVNDSVTVAEDGTSTVSPRPEEELSALSELVASAVGLDPARGDVITVRSMPFEPVALPGTEAIPAPGLAIDMMQIIRLAVLAIVTLLLGLFVVRPILMSGARRPVPTLPLALPGALTLDASGSPIPGLGPTATLPPMAPSQALSGPVSDVPVIAEAEPVDAVTRLRRLIEERQDETMQILQTWIEDPDQKERA